MLELRISVADPSDDHLIELKRDQYSPEYDKVKYQHGYLLENDMVKVIPIEIPKK